MQDEDLMTSLRTAAAKRLLRRLSEQTGVGYSYLSKLAQGYKPLSNLSAVYRAALESGIREILPNEGAAVVTRQSS